FLLCRSRRLPLLPYTTLFRSSGRIVSTLLSIGYDPAGTFGLDLDGWCNTSSVASSPAASRIMSSLATPNDASFGFSRVKPCIARRNVSTMMSEAPDSRTSFTCSATESSLDRTRRIFRSSTPSASLPCRISHARFRTGSPACPSPARQSTLLRGTRGAHGAVPAPTPPATPTAMNHLPVYLGANSVPVPPRGRKSRAHHRAVAASGSDERAASGEGLLSWTGCNRSRTAALTFSRLTP